VTSLHSCPAAMRLLTLAPHSISTSLLAQLARNNNVFSTSTPSVMRRRGEPKSRGPGFLAPCCLLLLSLWE
jgi:hypothetical protein